MRIRLRGIPPRRVCRSARFSIVSGTALIVILAPPGRNRVPAILPASIPIPELQPVQLPREVLLRDRERRRRPQVAAVADEQPQPAPHRRIRVAAPPLQ